MDASMSGMSNAGFRPIHFAVKFGCKHIFWKKLHFKLQSIYRVFYVTTIHLCCSTGQNFDLTTIEVGKLYKCLFTYAGRRMTELIFSWK